MHNACIHLYGSIAFTILTPNSSSISEIQQTTRFFFFLQVDQPKWGVGSRWPYLAGIHDLVIQNYTSLMIQTAVNIGISFNGEA